MIEPRIEGKTLILEIKGVDKIWTLKGHLEIPLEHIKSVRTDSEIVKSYLGGVKVAGARIPNVIKAGTFIEHEGKIFWDVHKPEVAVVLELNNENYSELIIEVADPAKFTEDLLNALNS